MRVVILKRMVNRKHINILLTARPCGTIVPGTTPPPSQGQTGQNGDFTVESTEKAGLSQRRVSICPGEGSRLSQGRFLFVPNTVPPQDVMFIVFLARTNIRKSVVSIKFPPVILGPEMAAPILWAPGIFWFFLLENPHAHKIPPFRGGGFLGFFVFLEGGGVEVPILFLWAWGFFRRQHHSQTNDLPPQAEA